MIIEIVCFRETRIADIACELLDAGVKGFVGPKAGVAREFSATNVAFEWLRFRISCTRGL